MSSRSFRNNLYKHTVSIILYVKTARLWESAASYVRKHLGVSKYWERSNGTVNRLEFTRSKEIVDCPDRTAQTQLNSI